MDCILKAARSIITCTDLGSGSASFKFVLQSHSRISSCQHFGDDGFKSCTIEQHHAYLCSSIILLPSLQVKDIPENNNVL